MSRLFRTFRAFSIPVIALMIGSSVAVAAPQGGHGGGAGHALGGFRGGGAYHGGYRGPYGYGYGYGYPYYGFPIGFGIGVGLGYGYGYGYPGYGYPAYGYPAYDPAYGPPPGAYPPQPGVYPQQAPPPVQVPPKTGGVTLNVRAPADAVIWVNGEKTTQTGPNREFATSGLLQGRTYTFDIRAEWRGADGKVVNLERRVPVQAGEHRIVDFEMRSSAPEVVVPVRGGNQ